MPFDEDPGRTRRTVLAAGLAAAASSAALTAARASEPGGTEAVAAAVEELRRAIQSGDGPALDRLTHPQLSYGHSSGRKIQSKAEFIASLAGKKNYETLTFTEQTIALVGDDALVRHVWDGADILPNDQVGRSYIAVLQVWLKTDGRWQLLARQSCPLKV